MDQLRGRTQQRDPSFGSESGVFYPMNSPPMDQQTYSGAHPHKPQQNLSPQRPQQHLSPQQVQQQQLQQQLQQPQYQQQQFERSPQLGGQVMQPQGSYYSQGSYDFTPERSPNFDSPALAPANLQVDHPRWAYSPGQQAVPLRQGPYLDAEPGMDESFHDASSLRGDPTNVYGADYNDAFANSNSLFLDEGDKSGTGTPRKGAYPSHTPMDTSLVHSRTDSPYEGGMAMSPSNVPAYAKQQNQDSYPSGGTAAARASAAAAGYTSPHSRNAQMFSAPSQEFGGLNSPRSRGQMNNASTQNLHAAGPPGRGRDAEYQGLDGTPHKSAGWLSGWRKWALLGLLLVIILAVALGAGLGAGLKKHGDANSNIAKANGGKDNVANPDTTSPKRDPLPAWNWIDSNQKVYGVNTGGQFLLERWLFEDWMVQTAGNDAWDEYSMSKILGPQKMKDVLNNHMATWFVEDHMDQFQKLGINMVRVPIGYWPFFDSSKVNEPYVNASQLAYFSATLNWAWERGMYVLVDLHGLPGSQNGDQSSGRNMSTVPGKEYAQKGDWFEDQNQQYSQQIVNTMLQWMDKHPARSAIAGFTPVNEPQSMGSNETRLSTLKKFYTFSINAAKKYNMPLVLHHGFVDDPYTYWEDYMEEQDPSMVIFDDHPYPAWYQTPEPEDQDDISQNICKLGTQGKNFPIPTVMGEYSAVTNVNTSQFTTDYLNTQLKVYGWSGGSMFFNFRANTSENYQAGPPPVIGKKYSLLDMIPQGNQVGQFPTYDPKSGSVADFTDGLSTACGSRPKYSWEK